MRWTNYHCHTQFCDGRAKAEDFVIAAIKNKLTTLGFSSHSPVPFDSVWNMKIEDLPKYIETIKQLKTQYANDIDILLSMETDYIPEIFGADDKMFSENKFDYLIGSIHYLDYLNDGTPWAIDGPNEWFDQGYNEIFNGDPKAYCKRFTDVSCEMMYKSGFDIVGHIDKMYQHGNRYFSLNEQWYRNLVAELLSTARDKQLIVEINTKSYVKHGFFYPHQSFFKLLKELGVWVTINSDTHDPELIDLAYPEAAEALIDSGINEVMEFRNGKWEMCKLTKKGVVL